MEAIKKLFEKRKELLAKKEELEKIIEPMDSIKERAPYVQQLSDIEDDIENNIDDIHMCIDAKISDHEPITFNVKIKITPNMDDVDYDVYDIDDTDFCIKELIVNAYKEVITDNIDGILYGSPEIKEITVE